MGASEYRNDYASTHGSSVRDCILLFGLNTYDFDEDGVRPERLAAFAQHASRVSSLCDHVDASLIQLHTNIRSLYADYDSWSAVGFGAGVLSTALCLSACIEPLKACGRLDLTRAIEHKLTAYDRGVARQIAVNRLKRLARLS